MNDHFDSGCDFTRIGSPHGDLVLAAVDDALVGIWFDGQKYQPPIGAGWRHRPDAPVLRRAATQLDEYFAGDRTRFDLALAPRGTPFQRAVWAAIATVPAGATITYAELAAKIGKPGSARAAGAATGRNPLSIVIPCHRIVGAGGALTGYAGGLDRKRALLALERDATATVTATARRAA
ncbi:MAG: methylated-DNA--[protein]-cysteine S-methyltransferase [Betaproteobacteria bacterium]